MKFKISKESVDKLHIVKGIDTSKCVEITDEIELGLGKSLTELIWEAYTEAIKNDIKANTVMVSKRLAKVNRFVHFFGNGYGDFPPLICGLEAYVTDELPEEFAFGVVEAPMTQREAVFEDGRKAGYKEGASEVAREIIKDIVDFADDKERQRLINGHSVWHIESDDVTDFIAELKKKYTEGKG